MGKKHKKKSCLVILIVIISVIMVSFITIKIASSDKSIEKKQDMKLSKEVVKEMGIGWNLGNTLEADQDWSKNADTDEYETAWGNPVTTKAMIDKVKEAGFKTIRIPVSWGPHMGKSPKYKVNKDWMNRIQEVVDYGIDNDMYVIINAHHEEKWCIPTYEMENEAVKQLESLWTQIADKFKDYDYHLIFETMNEPRVVESNEEWSGGTREGREVVNNFNEAALNAIRNTGGNNALRTVMIPTYGANSSEKALQNFNVPNDPNIIASLHVYTHYFFTMTQEGTKEWGTNIEKNEVKEELSGYHEFFSEKEIPLVIGEFGVINKNNLSERIKYTETYVNAATELGIPCLWWDNNHTTAGEDDSYGLLDRENLRWEFPELVDALIETHNNAIGLKKKR